ncbi:MAG: hypothetical protein QGD90_00260 [Candidatus Hydrogenedentes bacterium]|nr:hypothetical protein [Candidatus Hydrogenedentota bacterium]
MTTKSMEVTVKATIEIGDVERDVELKYICYPGEASSGDYPGHPPGAEYQSGFFCDTGEDCESFIDPADFEEDALEKAREIEAEDADAKDAALEAMADARRDGE